MIAALRREDGITLIEVMVAMVVLTVGLLAIFSVMDGAGKLTLAAERRQSISHLAQRELERLQSIPYDELALATATAHSTNAADPRYYVNYSGATCKEVEASGCYSWNAEKPSEAEPLVVAKDAACTATQEEKEEECGKVAASPENRPCSKNPVGACEWSDGRLSGDVYDFVTWHEDPVCAKETLCSAQSYKRVTVAVTVNAPSSDVTPKPVQASVLIAETNAVPKGTSAESKNPLENPAEIKCGAAEEECINRIAKGTPHTWMLHDKASEGSTTSGENHEVHPTVAPTSSSCNAEKTSTACPKPDSMTEGTAVNTTLYNYSTNLGTAPTQYAGGRVLEPTRECSATPTTPNNNAEELWASSPLERETKLNGAGGLTLFMQTFEGLTGTVTLCLGIYELPEKLENLIKSEASKEASEKAWIKFEQPSWPTAMKSVSSTFSFPEATIKKGSRIGLRIWEAKSSTVKVAIAYDVKSSEEAGGTEGDASYLQLNTE